MADTDFGAFADRGYLLDTDTLLAMDAGGGGVNVPGTAFVHYDAAGQVPIRTGLVVGQTGGSGSYGVQLLPRFAGSNFASASIVTNGSLLFFGSGDLGTPVAKLSLNLVSGDVSPLADGAAALGLPSARWSTVYAASGTIFTSDRDEKQQIGAIPDAWLDAWAGVDWCRFKMNDAVALKGPDDARWHLGLVAQHVYEAFAAHDVDGFAIGLVCFDEWEGGSRWGLRYDHAQAIEAAWQRRELARLAARLAAIEAA